jgi:hypothetical protein
LSPADRRLNAVADAAARWTDADFPPRVRATRALIARTGYTEPVVDYALDRLFGALGRAALRTTIEGELGSLAALDGFVSRAGRPDVAYRGLARVTIVSSDTTIGVALVPLAFALCAGSHVTVKDRDDRLIAAFGETLAEELPALGERFASDVWDGSDESTSRAMLAEADVVVAFGRPETLGAVRALAAPEARFLPYGHRTSAGYVTREALADEARARACADGAARDALLYDGEGCLSLHALFVERGGALDAPAFARRVAAACDAAAVEFPAGYAEPDAAVAAYRRSALFRAAQGRGEALAGVTAPHLVVFDPPEDEPPPLLRRTLAVYPVDGPAQAQAFLDRHALPLEALALARDARPRPDVEAFALASGASRVAPFGALQDPPLGGEHGGTGRILPFVRAIYRA